MMKIVRTRNHSGFMDNSEPAVQRLLSMSSALRNMKGSFHYHVVRFRT